MFTYKFLSPNRYKYIDSRNTIPIVRTADPDMEFFRKEKIRKNEGFL